VNLSLEDFCKSKKKYVSWALVAHACNSSYLGGRDQKDGGSRPAQTNSLRDPISKIPNIRKSWWSGSSGRTPAYEILSSSPSVAKIYMYVC
jgi:hypothetical protein